MEVSKVRIIDNTREGRREITKDDYAASIPPCCSFQSLEQHEAIGLCWSLLYRVEYNKPIAGMCDDCTENKVSPYGINSFGM